MSYWRDREEKHRQEIIGKEKEIEKEIESIYKDMMSECQKEINAFYGRYATAEGISISEAKKRISELDMDEYEALAKKYVSTKNRSKIANAQMRLYNATMKINRLEMLKSKLGLHLVDGFSKLEKLEQEQLIDIAGQEYKRQAGILGHTVASNSIRRRAKSVANGSFKNATFSERIWAHQSTLQQMLAKQLTNGMIQGKNAKVLARDIQKEFNTSRYNAERLMRTEMSRCQTEVQMDSFKENGFEEYTFLALGATACEYCNALNEKHFKVRDMEIGLNAPPMHPNCRCSTSAYIDDKAYNEWLNTLDEHGLTFEEWKNTKKDSESISAVPEASQYLQSQPVQHTNAAGALFGAYNDDNDPYYMKRERSANDYYTEIRNRDPEYEIARIAKNSGKTEDEIRRVYEHIFIREHLLDDGARIGRFAPSYEMAASWQRLSEGVRIQKHDLIMLEHELLEESIMGKSLDIPYEKAHNIADKSYSYSKALKEYLKEKRRA